MCVYVCVFVRFIEVIWIHNIFLFFHLVRTEIYQIFFRRVNRTHTAVQLRSMDFLYLIHTEYAR